MFYSEIYYGYFTKSMSHVGWLLSYIEFSCFKILSHSHLVQRRDFIKETVSYKTCPIKSFSNFHLFPCRHCTSSYVKNVPCLGCPFRSVHVEVLLWACLMYNTCPMVSLSHVKISVQYWSIPILFLSHIVPVPYCSCPTLTLSHLILIHIDHIPYWTYPILNLSHIDPIPYRPDIPFSPHSHIDPVPHGEN